MNKKIKLTNVGAIPLCLLISSLTIMLIVFTDLTIPLSERMERYITCLLVLLLQIFIINSFRRIKYDNDFIYISKFFQKKEEVISFNKLDSVIFLPLFPVRYYLLKYYRFDGNKKWVLIGINEKNFDLFKFLAARHNVIIT